MRCLKEAGVPYVALRRGCGKSSCGQKMNEGGKKRALVRLYVP